MEMKEADCACASLHRTSTGGAQSCLSNSVNSLVDDTGEKMAKRTKNETCSVDCCNCKTPLTDNVHSSSTKSNSNALTNSDDGQTSTGTTSSATCCGCTPSNVQQRSKVSSSQHRNSASREPPEEEEEEICFFSEDREFDFLKAPLLPRSSSLKSRKTTPPGTPTHRKSVRFADALGLDLELIRHILNPDDPPDVPSTAMRFLHTTDPLLVVSYWRVSFPHPATSENLTERVLHNKVSLESCSINNSNRRVYGTVRVANIAYAKDVRVRYSVNGWLTCADAQATYIEHSNDLITDRFSFELTIPEHLSARSRLEFAVRFSAANQIFWDNNFNRNYALECVDYHVL